MFWCIHLESSIVLAVSIYLSAHVLSSPYQAVGGSLGVGFCWVVMGLLFWVESVGGAIWEMRDFFKSWLSERLHWIHCLKFLVIRFWMVLFWGLLEMLFISWTRVGSLHFFQKKHTRNLIYLLILLFTIFVYTLYSISQLSIFYLQKTHEMKLAKE